MGSTNRLEERQVKVIDKLKDEPAVVLVIAAVVVVLGIDLAEIHAAVERIVQLVAAAVAIKGLRDRVTPVDRVTGEPRNPDYQLRDAG